MIFNRRLQFPILSPCLPAGDGFAVAGGLAAAAVAMAIDAALAGFGLAAPADVVDRVL